eukprot:scaffold1574_cov373-Prasinococcus_capsulatus_cf.AAC.4
MDVGARSGGTARPANGSTSEWAGAFTRAPLRSVGIIHSPRLRLPVKSARGHGSLWGGQVGRASCRSAL